jgi:hypothetical protein
MALDALVTRAIDVSAAGTFYGVGPKVYGGSNVQEIDLRGRMGIDATYALVVFVAGPVGANASVTVNLQSDDNTSFSSAKTQRAFAAAITATSGRNGNGTGPHLLGYITGPQERYLRFQLVAGAGAAPAAGVCTCAIMRDWPLTDLIP